MISQPIKPERRGARDRNAGGPTRPTPPSKNLGGRRGKPQSYAATSPLTLLQYPSPDVSLLAKLAAIREPAHKATRAANYIMHAIASGAPQSHAEKEVGLPPGSLVALLVRDRELLLQYCIALVEGANSHDREAQGILATASGQPTSAANTRTILNFVNSMRCAAEGQRRLSEALLRKGALAAREHNSRDKARFTKVWDTIIGAPGAYAPASSTVPTITTSDPFAAAKEILPQLRSDLAERRAGGEAEIDLVRLADNVSRVERFIKRKESVPASQSVPSVSVSIPAWVAPQPKEAKPARTHKTLDEQYVATAEYQRSPTKPGTVQYLKNMLKWAEDALPSHDPLAKRQLASLRGRVRAVDLDAIVDQEPEAGEPTETAGEPCSQVAQTTPPVQQAPKPSVSLSLNFKAPVRPETQSGQAPQPTQRALLAQMRAEAADARRRARGFPANSAIVLGAERLEAQLARMEVEMKAT